MKPKLEQWFRFYAHPLTDQMENRSIHAWDGVLSE